MAKKLIIVLCLMTSLSAQAGVMDKVRGVLTNLIGATWTERLLGFGESSAPTTSLKMPEIPTVEQLRLTTSTNDLLKKEATAFDKLPTERIRQFNFNFLQELFEVTRRTEARDEELSTWMNALDQGGSREGIYQSLVLDEVYNTLESIENSPSNKILDFVVYYSNKYLNQAMSKEQLAELNHYTLKRILTEKGIDVMEFYQTKNLDDLYRWYAFFSSDVAYLYPASFANNEVRSQKSIDYHYEWAKSMPIQHIKSEFIIKMHKLMNDLQEDQE